ncbi:MAG: TetR family transcriptional regulator C-terminal domain-containing protein [Candidatus Sulfotelmatobacter sp.]
MIDIVKQTSLTAEDVRGGYPLNNLAQEMSPLDEGFRKRLASVFQSWQMAIAVALRDGQMQGTVRSEVEPGKAAGFFARYVRSLHLSGEKFPRPPNVEGRDREHRDLAEIFADSGTIASPAAVSQKEGTELLTIRRRIDLFRA